MRGKGKRKKRKERGITLIEIWTVIMAWILPRSVHKLARIQYKKIQNLSASGGTPPRHPAERASVHLELTRHRKASPILLLRTVRAGYAPENAVKVMTSFGYEIMLTRGCWSKTLDVNKPWRQIPADRLLLWCSHIFFSDYPKVIRRGEISFKSNYVIERNFEQNNGTSSGQL